MAFNSAKTSSKLKTKKMTLDFATKKHWQTFEDLYGSPVVVEIQ